jgi:hypothetical protein
MTKYNFFIGVSLLILLFLIPGCSKSESTEQASVFQQIPEIADIKPQKPVKIKLKRNYDGNYAWELTGDNADEVLQADKVLKESLRPR